MKTFTKPSDPELRKKLSSMQYEVTQHEGTEPPFSNAYWNNKRPGIYVDVVSGEPLFSSLDKYDSGTGWPASPNPLSRKTSSRILTVNFSWRARGSLEKCQFPFRTCLQ